MRRCAVRRSGFTLLEMIAVVVILMLGTTVSVSVLRKRSGGAEFSERCRAFRDFCLEVRTQAMDTGRVRSVYLAAGEERCFEAGEPPEGAGNEITPLVPPPEIDPGAAQEAEEAAVREAALPAKRWEIPEDFVTETPEDGLFERQEIFRFHPDGGGFQAAELCFERGNFRAEFRIQPLTGELLLLEGDEEKGASW